MARFLYKGEKAYKKVSKCIEIRLRHKDGSMSKLKPGLGETHFTPGVSMIEVVEQRALRHTRADSRFQEIGP